MGSFVRLSGRISGAALAVAVLMAAPSAALAQPTVGASLTVNVPCSTSALAAAITQANVSGVATTIVLPFSCTFNIFAPATAADGLPIITGNITLAGTQNSVIRRVPFAPSFRILEVAVGGTLGVSHVAIQNGITAGLGGGILNGGTLSVSQAKFSGNTAGNGGAVANSAAATATISGTLINNNTTTGVGGGGIINSGLLTLSGSTVNANTAPINGGGLNTQAAGITRIFQTTFTNNTSGSLGGGISNLGTTSLAGSQVRLNTGSAGGGIATGNNNVTLTNTIVRDNNPDNCSPLNTIPGCSN